MRYWKQVCVMSAVIAFVAIGCLCLILYQDERANTKGKKRQEETPDVLLEYEIFPIDTQEELYERLRAFAQVLYEYDTAERMYYEGAEEYMTQKAYRELYPASALEDRGKNIRIRSTLMETNVYAYYESVTEVGTIKKADVILESRFSLAQGTNGALTQYLKLALEEQEGKWMITQCRIIDTLEE